MARLINNNSVQRVHQLQKKKEDDAGPMLEDEAEFWPHDLVVGGLGNIEERNIWNTGKPRHQEAALDGLAQDRRLIEGVLEKSKVRMDNYSSVYKKKETPGHRSQIPKLSYCAAPPILKTLIQNGRFNELTRDSFNQKSFKNRRVSEAQRKSKEKLREQMLTKHHTEVLNYTQWKNEQLLDEILELDGRGKPPKSASHARQRQGRSSKTAAKPPKGGANIIDHKRVRPNDMNQPKLNVCLPGSIPNYVSEQHAKTGALSKNVYPNCTPVQRHEYDALMENQAQEQAYWIQFGTATFQVNKNYKEAGLEVTGVDPYARMPQKMNEDWC